MTLRNIGKAQAAFRNLHDTQVYGSFDELQKEKLIHEDYSLETLTENYTLTWEVSYDPDLNTDGSTFTIIAFPLDTRRGYLETFAISEDQVVRIFDRDHGNVWESIKTWDPIL